MSEVIAVPGESIMSTDDARFFLMNMARAMQDQELRFQHELEHIHPKFQVSARNLLHYLVLRSEDIRPLQQYLHDWGLSSLTSSESHTLAQLLQVVRWLYPQDDLDAFINQYHCNFNTAIQLRRKHLKKLLGSDKGRDVPHIMVTLSAELANDLQMIEQLLVAGMSVARINCAHDDPSVWSMMIANVRSVAEKTAIPCKIYMDLSGPRIRVTEVPVRKRESTEGLKVCEGDVVELTEEKGNVIKNRRRKNGSIKTPARIVVQPRGITGMLEVGERIFFDDGKFEAKIIETREKKVVVMVTRMSTRKPVLRPGKGVNLPDSALTLSSLTEEDLEHLPFIAANADLIGYSFVSGPGDIRKLRDHLRTYEDKVPAIILKIERLSAVKNLPALLLEGMRDRTFGVMIARGDLAVEIGFERLSEIQQEILWICEAAHVPVIWATQVLERMNKTGFATRSEITDAAMGAMAECVMLNKGKHVVKTVNTLVDILTRFSLHSDKKRFTFRPLSIARNFLFHRK
jgi:pyruvate kinase